MNGDERLQECLTANRQLFDNDEVEALDYILTSSPRLEIPLETLDRYIDTIGGHERFLEMLDFADSFDELETPTSFANVVDAEALQEDLLQQIMEDCRYTLSRQMMDENARGQSANTAKFLQRETETRKDVLKKYGLHPTELRNLIADTWLLRKMRELLLAEVEKTDGGIPKARELADAYMRIDEVLKCESLEDRRAFILSEFLEEEALNIYSEGELKEGKLDLLLARISGSINAQLSDAVQK